MLLEIPKIKYSRRPDDPEEANGLLRLMRMRMKLYHLAHKEAGPVFMTSDLLRTHFGNGCFGTHEIQHIDHAFAVECAEWAPYTIRFIDDEVWGLSQADAQMFFGENPPFTGDIMAVWHWGCGSRDDPNAVVLHFANEEDAVLARLLVDREYV